MIRWMFLVHVAMLLGCNTADNAPPVIANPCTDVDCSGNGVCAPRGGRAECECDDGHEGEDCSQCLPGFDNVEGRCVAGDPCDIHECGSNEECTSSSGVAECECASGFFGEPGSCVEAQECASDSCERGVCDDASGLIECTCETGFGGERCDRCADGYVQIGEDCARLIPCSEANPCGDHGTCQDGPSGVICQCSSGYAGERCEACAATHYRGPDGVCVVRQNCAAGACSSRGMCDDSSGVPRCICNVGYDGAECEACAGGYVRNSTNACVAAQTCQAATCFGNGICDDSSGLVSCTCDFGYNPPFCDGCAVGHIGGNCEGCNLGYTLQSTGCVPTCGDGRFVDGEACEDGNTEPADGVTDFCSPDCFTSLWPGPQWPGYIPPTNSNAWVTWRNMNINGSGTRYVKVSAGQQVTVSGRFEYNATTSGCSGCVTQLYLGFFQENSTSTSGTPFYCRSFTSSLNTDFTTTITAPTQPGTYFVRWSRANIAGCQTTMVNEGSAHTLFAVYVE